jgi:hypothetical protein
MKPKNPSKNHNRYRSKKGFAKYLWLVLPLVLFPVKYAHAYLDAGTGSYAIQVAIGVIFGGAYAFRNFAGRIVSHFNKKDKNSKED